MEGVTCLIDYGGDWVPQALGGVHLGLFLFHGVLVSCFKRNDRELFLNILVLDLYFYVMIAVLLVQLGLAGGYLYISLYGTADSYVSTIVVVVVEWMFAHAVTEGIAFFLCQPGVGTGALKRTIAFSSVWGLFTAGINYYRHIQLDEDNLLLGNIIGTGYQGVLTVCYLYLYIAPRQCMYRRPALKSYSLFCFSTNLLYLAGNLMAIRGEIESEQVEQEEQYSICMIAGANVIIVGCFMPSMVYFTLVNDTRYNITLIIK